MTQPVVLMPHDPEWAATAEAWAAAVAGLLGGNTLAVHHIGSTATPGIAAKPVIDLMPVVRSLDAVEAVRPALEAAGHRWMGEYGLPGRCYLPKDDPTTGRRLMNVHLWQQGAPDIARHLAFRDYLRVHPDEARAYEAEKRRAMARHPDDVGLYSDAKGSWILAAERRALAWWREGAHSL